MQHTTEVLHWVIVVNIATAALNLCSSIVFACMSYRMRQTIQRIGRIW